MARGLRTLGMAVMCVSICIGCQRDTSISPDAGRAEAVAELLVTGTDTPGITYLALSASQTSQIARISGAPAETDSNPDCAARARLGLISGDPAVDALVRVDTANGIDVHQVWNGVTVRDIDLAAVTASYRGCPSVTNAVRLNQPDGSSIVVDGPTSRDIAQIGPVMEIPVLFDWHGDERFGLIRLVEVGERTAIQFVRCTSDQPNTIWPNDLFVADRILIAQVAKIRAK